jgi:cytidine deaminase
MAARRGRERELIAAARAVRRRAHAPYSGFQVGAAVRVRGGRIFAGCNVENASLGAGICAERNAVLQAVAAGLKPGGLEAVAVYTEAETLTPPCGMCLQVLVEFGHDPEVWLAAPGKLRRVTLRELYPEPFTEFRAGRARRS